jgi:hypothetical protein
MNDLERDIKALFETKAGEVQATPLAPQAVLRRGRRRQVGTLVGGAVMAVAAGVVLIGGASAFLADRAQTPPMGAGKELPARTATIAGVTVTAPQGWSLLDQTMLAMALPAQTCISTGEGSVPIAQGSEAEQTTTEECTPIALPSGAPLFTLGNVEPNPAQTVCEVIPELSVQGVGRTDAFLYVALDPSTTGNAIGTSWPTTLESGLPDRCGTALQASWTAGGMRYFAAALLGEDVSDEDRSTLIETFEGLAFGPLPEQPAMLAPGFVVAASEQDAVAWRLVAGPAIDGCDRPERCIVALTLVTTDGSGAEEAIPVAPPGTGSSFSSGSAAVGGSEVVFGMASSSVESIEIVSSDGTTVPATTVAYPATMQAYATSATPIPETVWYATVTEVQTIRAVLDDGTEGWKE